MNILGWILVVFVSQISHAFSQVTLMEEDGAFITDIKVIGCDRYYHIIELWKQRIRPLVPSQQELYLDLPMQISAHLKHLDFVITRCDLQSETHKERVTTLYQSLVELFEGSDLKIHLLVTKERSLFTTGNYKLEKIEPF